MAKISVSKQRFLWWSISGALVLAGLISVMVSLKTLGAPLRPSLDFVGGTRLQLELDCTVANNCDRPIKLGDIRDVMGSQGLASQGVQIVGEDRHGVSIRTSDLDVARRSQLISALEEKIGKFDPSRTQIDTVGPTIGRQLLSAGLLSLIVALAGIMAYLSFRFQFDYAVLAILALIHDVGITAGIFSILGLAFGTEVDSLFIVALLTITGFSVNDTVVIYDRIRELLKLNPDGDIGNLVDDAVNQTLTRSINTTSTTLLPLVAIFIFGGETLKYFALALIIGFILGAYSSIFIASSALAWWRERQAKLQPALADGEIPQDSASEGKPED
ncbi:MAG TPA: protein translocase subunit SecF [Oscillatoriales cyanobacterium M4454_W2019_049]|nr:MAG: protein translocase subunit SecF [Cyanobacteria bacterium J055]HIK33608.1 protein translocase subunit SecF [Oscillatoriales cyanobacterium M4454_W2019_049]